MMPADERALFGSLFCALACAYGLRAPTCACGCGQATERTVVQEPPEVWRPVKLDLSPPRVLGSVSCTSMSIFLPFHNEQTLSLRSEQIQFWGKNNFAGIRWFVREGALGNLERIGKGWKGKCKQSNSHMHGSAFRVRFGAHYLFLLRAEF